MKEILQYLKKHGERLDTEIAEASGNVPIAAIQCSKYYIAQQLEPF